MYRKIYIIRRVGYKKIEVNEKSKKKESATKKISFFWSLPNNLIIVLKRFNNNNKKNKEMIDFPINNLDLTKYVIGYDNKSYKYDLYGICNHSGGTLGGHYTAYVKNANKKLGIYIMILMYQK